MTMKEKYVWKIRSGADWYLREVVDTIAYAFAFVGIGAFLGWLINVW